MLARLFSRPFFLALLLWILAGAVLYFLTNMLAMPYVAGKFKGTVKVPSLVSLPPEQAKDILNKNGLIYMLDSTGDYSTDVAAGKILTQYPETGTEVKKGRRIWVKISKGLKSVELPSLRGLSLRQAEITLQQLGLKVGRVREVRNAIFPAGAVIGTSPAAKATLEKGREVNIELSQGKEAGPAGMPSLVGLSLSQAKLQIKTLDLSLGKITYKKDARSLPNTVLSQSPAAGGDFQGRSVDLVVTK
ncbi:MAG TPA: PASTA domain-containing protein [Fibrobacteria bacterium]|nr:PASTA domain-containing protein [Fibrobacteria bacterium]